MSLNKKIIQKKVTIGVFGLGYIGLPRCIQFAKKNFNVFGFDVDSDRRAALSQAGGVGLYRLEDVAGFDLILLSLPTSHVVADVVSLLKEELRSGQTIVDTTTGNPAEVESTADVLVGLGVDYLDATVGGSSQQARGGDVVIMGGGPVDAFDRCRELFGDLAKRTFHLGPAGSGARMKLAVNLVLGLNRAVLAEGLVFGLIR